MDPEPNWQKLQTEQPWREERGGQDDRLVLSIGGQMFETSRQTLCVDGNSMLAAWVLRHHSHGNAPLWIDRDAQRFQHVLNYLRNGTIWLQDVASLRAVQEEAAFYGLAGLHALCKEKIQNIEAKEEAIWRRRLNGLKEALKQVLGNMEKNSTSGPREKGDVVAYILRGSRENEDPVFHLDADF
ncbi:hypothetical protein O6H91_10G004000 [Diphasiastrum complanatum]|uniref:Uncharacterized protein n=2 Tax=Diphasiastrum complanatum TaxID=34168 RepID=A0ACC2CE89_DIPCM|nr:hypothetical protein O6H91_13G023400 [Diphasiastrum complanatum]KAJ7540174.1 hypothetical protein O6H91_10G004000 [Diphasiastrum complanatum]